MPIRYDKFFELLKQKGYSTYSLRKNRLISESILQKLRSGTGGNSKNEIDTRTIEKICKLLDCQPGDIMEYIPGDE